jgi:hypothetical protein
MSQCVRPDFYRAMGWEYGPKMSQYRIDPAAFPKGSTKEHVRNLGPDDKEAFLASCNRFADQTHGMMYKTEREMRSLFRRQENQIGGQEKDGQTCTLKLTIEDSFLTENAGALTCASKVGEYNARRPASPTSRSGWRSRISLH